MKIGDVVEALERAEQARMDVIDAETSITFGGCPETVLRKDQDLRIAQLNLDDILEEEILS